MLIRVRSNVGVWRVDGLDGATATVADVLSGIAVTRPHVAYETPLSRDPACREPLHATQTLVEQNLTHGSMVHCRVDAASTCVVKQQKSKTSDGGDDDAAATDGLQEKNEEAAAVSKNMKRVIDKNGKIQLVHSDSGDLAGGGGQDSGFRPGMLALRDMKMQWTLNEFVALDSQYTFKIKRQEEAVSNGVSLDTAAIGDFQTYLRRFSFSRSRCGYLYGKFVEGDNNSVLVEAVYEPPQEADLTAAEGFVLHDDPMEDTVEQLAQLLGLRRVGWIFGHPPREEGFHMSAAEVIMAAELQLEAAGGIEKTPFVTVKVTMGDDGNVSVEAFQVSQQCMEMVAEEALEVGTDPKVCVVNDTFTAIQEGKESKTVDNNFFLTVVPIVQHTSDMFVSQFPKLNRDLDDRIPSHDELKKQLSKSGTAGWTFVDLMADFHLLLYLCKFLDMSTDIPKLCESVVNRDIPLDDGYKLIIASMAGMDGAY